MNQPDQNQSKVEELKALFKTAKKSFDKQDYKQVILLLENVKNIERFSQLKQLLDHAKSHHQELQDLLDEMEYSLQTKQMENFEQTLIRILELKSNHAKAKKLLEIVESYKHIPEKKRHYLFDDDNNLKLFETDYFFLQVAGIISLLFCVTLGVSYYVYSTNKMTKEKAPPIDQQIAKNNPQPQQQEAVMINPGEFVPTAIEEKKKNDQPPTPVEIPDLTMNSSNPKPPEPETKPTEPPTESMPAKTKTPPEPVDTSFDGHEPGELLVIKGSNIKLHWCPPGKFSPSYYNLTFVKKAELRKLISEINVDHGFWLGETELTYKLYQHIFPDYQDNFTLTHTNYEEYPISDIDYLNIKFFCKLLTEKEQSAGNIPKTYKFRLPTVDEWELAVRAGTTTNYFYGDDPNGINLKNYAWYSKNAKREKSPVKGEPLLYVKSEVKKLLPNPYGLYDVYGNLNEICLGKLDINIFGDDQYIEPDKGIPLPSTSNDNRQYLSDVFSKGGCILYNENSCQSSIESTQKTYKSSNYCGFRLILSSYDPTKK